MATHDLLVFPTMDESHGWVVAEAGICGLPTISSNVFALPELVVDEKTGWIISVPLNDDKRWEHIGLGNARDAFVAAQETLVDGLVDTLSRLADDKGAISRAGLAARAHIEALYNINAASAQLGRLYAAARDV